MKPAQNTMNPSITVKNKNQIGRPRINPNDDQFFNYWYCPDLDQMGQEFRLRKLTAQQYKVIQAIRDYPGETRIYCALRIDVSINAFTNSLGRVIQEWAKVIDPNVESGADKVAIILEIFDWYKDHYPMSV